MRNRKINIGILGWSYKHWKEKFYPEEMKPPIIFFFIPIILILPRSMRVFIVCHLSQLSKHGLRKFRKDFGFVRRSIGISHTSKGYGIRKKPCQNFLKFLSR